MRMSCGAPGTVAFEPPDAQDCWLRQGRRQSAAASLRLRIASPHNGPPISGESALEGFVQPTPVGAKPHEPPPRQPKAATPYAGGDGRPRTP